MITIGVGSINGVYFLQVSTPFEAQSFIEEALVDQVFIDHSKPARSVQLDKDYTIRIPFKDTCILTDAETVARRLKYRMTPDIIMIHKV